MPSRLDGRDADALRPIELTTGVQRDAAGSVLVRWGHTHVLCAASFDDRVPVHRQGSGGGWVSAEYSMRPGSTKPRARRERTGPKGRTAEIQRLIGRSLRAVINLDAMPARTLWLDCDVLQADGGTRCASITGAYIAAQLALPKLALPPVAAVSVGVIDDRVLVDLCYEEDVTAEVDLNFVATAAGIVEVQGTAERRPYSRARLNAMLDGAQSACERIFALQRGAVERGR